MNVLLETMAIWLYFALFSLTRYYNRDGTVLAILLQDSLLWMTILIYIGMRVWARYGIPSFVAQLGSGSNITVIGGFVSFFLVFYVNQNHKRYFNLYSKSMACKGRIFDVATIAVTSTLPKSVSTRLVRYMNAAHVAGYTGLSQTYPCSSFFMHLNKDLGLLTKEELSRMDDIDLDKGGSCQRELIAWSMMEIQKCHKEGIIDNELAVQLREQILQLRAAFGQLFNAADLPIPFFYVHFVCLLSAFYLPLFAISGAYNAGTGNEVHWTADVVSGLVVILNSIFVIGLRILGQKMSDPYGDDLIDLSVIFYCTFTWRMSNRVLNAQFPSDDASSESVEQELVEYRSETIGKAFEADITVDTPISSSSSDDDDDNGDSDDFDNDGLPINQREDGMERNQPKSARFQFPRRGGGP